MSVIPATRYARARDGVSIAYQVIGTGPVDLVWVPGWVSHVETAWEEPTMARFFERLAAFSRLILLDNRGTGDSEAPADPATYRADRLVDDVEALRLGLGL